MFRVGTVIFVADVHVFYEELEILNDLAHHRVHQTVVLLLVEFLHSLCFLFVDSLLIMTLQYATTFNR